MESFVRTCDCHRRKSLVYKEHVEVVQSEIATLQVTPLTILLISIALVLLIPSTVQSVAQITLTDVFSMYTDKTV